MRLQFSTDWGRLARFGRIGLLVVISGWCAKTDAEEPRVRVMYGNKLHHVTIPSRSAPGDSVPAVPAATASDETPNAGQNASAEGTAGPTATALPDSNTSDVRSAVADNQSDKTSTPAHASTQVKSNAAVSSESAALSARLDPPPNPKPPRISQSSRLTGLESIGVWESRDVAQRKSSRRSLRSEQHTVTENVAASRLADPFLDPRLNAAITRSSQPPSDSQYPTRETKPQRSKSSAPQASIGPVHSVETLKPVQTVAGLGQSKDAQRHSAAQGSVISAVQVIASPRTLPEVDETLPVEQVSASNVAAPPMIQDEETGWARSTGADSQQRSSGPAHESSQHLLAESEQTIWSPLTAVHPLALLATLLGACLCVCLCTGAAFAVGRRFFPSREVLRVEIVDASGVAKAWSSIADLAGDFTGKDQKDKSAADQDSEQDTDEPPSLRLADFGSDVEELLPGLGDTWEQRRQQREAQRAEQEREILKQIYEQNSALQSELASVT